MNQANTKTAIELLAEHKKQYEALVQRRTQAQVEVETAKRQLAEAQAEALREFGTADEDELRALLRSREQDNNRLVMDFLLQLETVERQLATIEQELGEGAPA